MNLSSHITTIFGRIIQDVAVVILAPGHLSGKYIRGLVIPKSDDFDKADRAEGNNKKDGTQLFTG